MALVVKDRVKETTTTTGTGALSLAGAETNFIAFSAALSDGDTTYYAIVDSTNDDFEVGLGTYASGGNTLTRTTVLASSNAGSAVNLSAGTKDVFVTYPADKSVYLDSSGNIASVTITSADINGGTVDGANVGATTAGTGKFTTLNATGKTTFDAEIEEQQYSLTGTAIDPANGTIQYKTLGANTTFTESLADGEYVTLMIDDGTGYTITWPTTTWVGGSAPTLETNGYNVIELWHVNGTLYGAFIGSAA